jgi:hypothetical protein
MPCYIFLLVWNFAKWQALSVARSALTMEALPKLLSESATIDPKLLEARLYHMKVDIGFFNFVVKESGTDILFWII